MKDKTIDFITKFHCQNRLHFGSWPIRKRKSWSYFAIDVVFILGKRPYGEKPMSDVMHEVCILNQHLDVPRNCPLELSDQLGQCWSYYPKDRPSFRDLLHIIKSYLNPYESDSGS